MTALLLLSACEGAPGGGRRALGAETAPYLGLRITQVAYDTAGDEFFEEFIELFNQNEQPLSLAGWSLEDNFATFAFPDNAMVPPRSYFSIAKDAAAFSNLHGGLPDLDRMNLFLDNGGDLVKLIDPDGNISDVVAWQWFVPGWSLYTPHGDSLVRLHRDGDWGLAGDWVVRSPAAPDGAL